MSTGFNRVNLLGNLGNDPELRITQGGQAVLKFSLATSESYVDRSNVRQERTEWHRVTVFGKRAEALAKLLAKGARIFVEGSLHTSSYEKDGEKRYSTEIIAKDILFAGRSKERDSDDRGDGRRAPAQAGESFDSYADGTDEIPF